MIYKCPFRKKTTHLSIHAKISVFCSGILLKELQICANQLLPFRWVGLLCGVEKLPPILSVDDHATSNKKKRNASWQKHVFLRNQIILQTIWQIDIKDGRSIFCNKNVFFYQHFFWTTIWQKRNKANVFKMTRIILFADCDEWMRKKHGQFLFCYKQYFFVADNSLCRRWDGTWAPQ